MMEKAGHLVVEVVVDGVQLVLAGNSRKAIVDMGIVAVFLTTELATAVTVVVLIITGDLHLPAAMETGTAETDPEVAVAANAISGKIMEVVVSEILVVSLTPSEEAVMALQEMVLQEMVLQEVVLQEVVHQEMVHQEMGHQEMDQVAAVNVGNGRSLALAASETLADSYTP